MINLLDSYVLFTQPIILAPDLRHPSSEATRASSRILNCRLQGATLVLRNKSSSKKSTSRQRSGKGAIRKRFPLQKPRWEKTKLTIRYLYTYTMKHIVSRMSSYFPKRWPLNYLNLTKNMKTYIRRQQHKHFEHQDIKQK